MEYPYKVKCLSSPRVKDVVTNPVDGLALAKDMEALILEYATIGYQLLETTSVNNHVVGSYTGSDTTGLMVIFKIKE